MEATWEQLYLDPTQTFDVYDVLEQKAMGTATGKISASVGDATPGFVEPSCNLMPLCVRSFPPVQIDFHAVKFVRMSPSSSM